MLARRHGSWSAAAVALLALSICPGSASRYYFQEGVNTTRRSYKGEDSKLFPQVIESVRKHMDLLGQRLVGHKGSENVQQDRTVIRRHLNSHERKGEVLKELAQRCPSLVSRKRAEFMGSGVKWATQFVRATAGAQARRLMEGWKDPFYTMVYSLNKGNTEASKTRHADAVPLPFRKKTVTYLKVHNLWTPVSDIDHEDDPNLDTYGCLHGMVRNFCWNDFLNDDKRNVWNRTLDGKLDYKEMLSVVERHYDFETLDGVPGYPVPEIDFAANYFKNDVWSDMLEHDMAFTLIGAHRVQVTERAHRGETLPYVVSFNAFSGVQTRKYFGHYGVDMYFTEDGIPALLITPDGQEIERGDKTWQYWKFVWRCSLLGVVTVKDHLFFSHYQIGSSLAKETRAILSPKHPLRRLLSIFTFGTIQVNVLSLETLVSPGHMLDRATPFEHYQDFASLVEETLPDPSECETTWLLNRTTRSAMPTILREAPFFADSFLVFTALKNLVNAWFTIYANKWCDDDGLLKDREILQFASNMKKALYRGRQARDVSLRCSDFKDRLELLVFLVTAWHRHVGMVADFFRAPHLGTFSWRAGEAYGRPLQHMITSVVAANTGLPQPKLNEDFSHIFAGMEREGDAVKAWKDFTTELDGVSQVVAKRNSERGTTPNSRGDPSQIECSIAV